MQRAGTSKLTYTFEDTFEVLVFCIGIIPSCTGFSLPAELRKMIKKIIGNQHSDRIEAKEVICCL